MGDNENAAKYARPGDGGIRLTFNVPRKDIDVYKVNIAVLRRNWDHINDVSVENEDKE